MVNGTIIAQPGVTISSPGVATVVDPTNDDQRQSD
jgi:hypothetical protein